MSEYTTDDIYVMEEIDHIRTSTGMYIGSTENATRLLEELLDNALDEVQAGHCDIIGVFIDTKEGTFSVLDYGRGLPFNQDLPPDQDPPIMTATKLFSSGKFKKDKKNSAYKISVGLHGCGMVVVNALSDWMKIEIYKNDLHGFYNFNDASDITRKQEVIKLNKGKPFATKISVKPSKRFFNSTHIDLGIIEERIRIACANFRNLKAILRVDGEDMVIRKSTEKDLILSYITKSELSWMQFDTKKGPESCHVMLAWDTESPVSNKVFSCVNLARVHTGVHINHLFNALKNVFAQLGKKYKYDFNVDDCLSFLRCYINLKIIKTSFEAQVKVRLESKSDLSVMEPLEDNIKKYLEKNKEMLIELLGRFQSYRQDLSSKKLSKTTKTRRLSSKFTKLRDCKSTSGELLIGEGESAVGGLLHVRNPKKHAILPLRGVISNVLTKKYPLENNEVRGIIEAVGTGIEPDCKVSKLRYSKIILSADADPAGAFITSLLIAIFAKLTPAIIKAGKLYVCKTPLFGTRRNGKLVPLWTKEDVDDARSNNESIKRFKGLGEFSPKDLKVFTLDESTRKLIKVNWSDKYKQLFKLMSTASERRKLVLGEWELED